MLTINPGSGEIKNIEWAMICCGNNYCCPPLATELSFYHDFFKGTKDYFFVGGAKASIVSISLAFFRGLDKYSSHPASRHF